MPGTQEEYLSWATPLSRIDLHAGWCQMCKILLSMLCRDEHDPLKVPEVRNHVKQDWLRGVPLQTWVSKGYIHQDDYWPFGRSESRHEGSTQVLGPLFENLKPIAKRSSYIGVKVLTRSAVTGRAPQVKLEDPVGTELQRSRLVTTEANRRLCSSG